MTNFCKTRWQNVEAEPSDELDQSQSHLPSSRAVTVVLVGKDYFLASMMDCENTLVTNCYSVSIPREVSEHLPWPSKGRFAEHAPFHAPNFDYQLIESRVISEL